MKNNHKQASQLADIIVSSRFTKQEAATALNISLSTLNRYLDAGLMKFEKLGNSRNSRVYILKSEILRFAKIEEPNFSLDPKKSN